MSKDDTSNPTTEKSFHIDITEDILADLGDPGALEELNKSMKDSELEKVSGGGLLSSLSAPMTFYGEGGSKTVISNEFIRNATNFKVGDREVHNMMQFRAALYAHDKRGLKARISYS